MNWANRLTIGRLFLTLLFVVALSVEWRFSATAGLILFCLASVTDYIDGEIARRYSLVTDFGKLMDPLVDKIMVAAAFICLVWLNALPAWIVIAIISREFLITGLRTLAMSKGRLLPAESLGKHKTIWQIVTILFFLGLLSVRELEQVGLHHEAFWWNAIWQWGGTILPAAVLVLTLYSGLRYFWKNRDVLDAA